MMIKRKTVYYKTEKTVYYKTTKLLNPDYTQFTSPANMHKQDNSTTYKKSSLSVRKHKN